MKVLEDWQVTRLVRIHDGKVKEDSVQSLLCWQLSKSTSQSYRTVLCCASVENHTLSRPYTVPQGTCLWYWGVFHNPCSSIRYR